MWRFIAGFIAGVYVNQKYHLPELDYWIKKMTDEENKRRK